jgi:hypothetical protein
MRKAEKVTIVLFSLLALGIFAVYMSFVSYNEHFAPLPLNSDADRLVVNQPFTNGTDNAIFVEVKSLNSDINLSQAIIRTFDVQFKAVVTEPLSTVILEGESATLKINGSLTSGNYSVSLPVKGVTFQSPPFSIP